MLRLMAVTDDAVVADRDVVALCHAVVRGGATAVQLRLKRCDPRELATLARQLVDGLSVPLLVNDRLDVALAVGAAGVHLGGADLPVALARRLAPPGFVIGSSVGSAAEVPSGEAADYWGVGPWRVSTTKTDAGAPLGRDGLGTVIALAGSRPCIAIGGIRPEDVRPILEAGGAGVAVSSGLFGVDPEAAAERYLRAGRLPSRGSA
jgi:thiamine-phosphate pyrophosphorylase